MLGAANLRKNGSLPGHTKSDRYFLWLGKKVSSPINKNVNNMSPNWLL